MRILFLTNVLPFRRRNGGEVCSARLLTELSGIASRVLVLGRGDVGGAPTPPNLEIHSLADQAVEFAKLSTSGKLISLLHAVAGGKSWTVQRMSSDGVLDKLRTWVQGEDFDCVFVDHLQIYEWYQALALDIPAILMAHNVEQQVYRELLQTTTGAMARWALEREHRLLHRLDETAVRTVGAIACLTQEDREHYVALAREGGGSATVEVLPSYFDVTGIGILVPPIPAACACQAPRIAILGTWTWESNRLGLEWFLREVLPHIDSACAIVIAGRGLRREELPERVQYVGFVESAELFYRASDVIAIPSIAGGGVQEKTIEAIGYGIPVVATSVAVRGISTYPSHVQIVETAREFATACSQPISRKVLEAQVEAAIWNDLRRVQYRSALLSLLAAATGRRTAVGQFAH